MDALAAGGAAEGGGSDPAASMSPSAPSTPPRIEVPPTPSSAFTPKGSSRAAKRCASKAWSAALGGRKHLKTTDVHLTCQRFRQLRSETGGDISDSMLTMEELA